MGTIRVRMTTGNGVGVFSMAMYSLGNWHSVCLRRVMAPSGLPKQTAVRASQMMPNGYISETLRYRTSLRPEENIISCL